MKCPLCGKMLLSVGPKPADLICQTRVKFTKADLPHYSQRDRDTNDSIIWYLPPYKLINIGDFSEIWTVIDATDTHTYWAPEFKFITKVPIIHPDKPEIVTKRIKNLIIFS